MVGAECAMTGGKNNPANSLQVFLMPKLCLLPAKPSLCRDLFGDLEMLSGTLGWHSWEQTEI